MAAVQAYGCASGKGKKPSWTNALARRHPGTAAAANGALRPSGVALARLQAHPQLELRGVHLSSDGPVGHQGLGLASSSAAEPTFALLECADRAQEVDLAERGPVDVCEV